MPVDTDIRIAILSGRLLYVRLGLSGVVLTTVDATSASVVSTEGDLEYRYIELAD